MCAARFNVRIHKRKDAASDQFRIGLHPNAGSATKQAVPVRIYPSRRGQHRRNEQKRDNSHRRCNPFRRKEIEFLLAVRQ